MIRSSVGRPPSVGSLSPHAPYRAGGKQRLAPALPEKTGTPLCGMFLSVLRETHGGASSGQGAQSRLLSFLIFLVLLVSLVFLGFLGLLVSLVSLASLVTLGSLVGFWLLIFLLLPLVAVGAPRWPGCKVVAGRSSAIDAAPRSVRPRITSLIGTSP